MSRRRMEGGSRSIAPLIPKFRTGREWLNLRPRSFTAPPIEKDRDTTCTEGWVGPTVGLDSFGKEKNHFPLPGFEPRTVHPMASRYTDKVIPSRAFKCSAPLSKQTAITALNSINWSSCLHRASMIIKHFIIHLKHNIQCVPLATEPGISLIILPLMRILQRNLKRTYLIV